MQIEARRRRELRWITSEHKTHIRARLVMSGIIAEEAAVSSSILVPMACMPPLLSVILSSSLRFGVLRQSSWGPGGGQVEPKGGPFLKGSSQ